MRHRACRSGLTPRSVVQDAIIPLASGISLNEWQVSMGTPDQSAIARLAEVFGTCQEEIISEWRLQAGALLKELKLDKPTITNHLPDIIAEITQDLAHCRISPETTGESSSHGVQRYHDGLDVGEVVAEFNLLRVAFITIAERHGLNIVGDAIHIINYRIDEAVRYSVVAFAAQQKIIRKEQEQEHLAFVAHDLRTPLNAISLVVDAIKEGLDPKALQDAEDLFEILQRNLTRVGLLINSVLEKREELSAAGTNYRPVKRTFELWPLAQRSITDLRQVTSKLEIDIDNQIPHTLTVFADALLIAQVFQNLLGNAFKYTGKGRVTLSAMEEGDAVVCVVRDNGAGIPWKMLARVFEKHATDPGKDGSGLGLVIVKQIVEAHGGSVGVESTEGAGASFRFSIPSIKEGD
jgi:two-component system phosphate regulon sensor histidine kinase PhoR